MTQLEMMNIFLFFLSLVLLHEVVLFLLKHRLERFRQRLFSVRNALFDFAADGGIPFDHPAYRITRRRINSLIRYGHNINSLHTLFMWYEFRRDPQMMSDLSEFDRQLHDACKKLPYPAQERIQKTYEQVQKILADHLQLVILLSKIYRVLHFRKPQNQNSDYENMRVVMHEAAVVDSGGKSLHDADPILVG